MFSAQEEVASVSASASASGEQALREVPNLKECLGALIQELQEFRKLQNPRRKALFRGAGSRTRKQPLLALLRMPVRTSLEESYRFVEQTEDRPT